VLRTKQRTTVDGATVGEEERAHSYRWVGQGSPSMGCTECCSWLLKGSACMLHSRITMLRGLLLNCVVWVSGSSVSGVA
jgi:hypothetical protein